MKIINLNKTLPISEDKLKQAFGYYEAGRLIITSTQPDSRFEKISIENVPYKTEFQTRNQGLIDPSELQKKHVTIFGLGSGGSKIAESLVRAGCVHLRIIDYDEVTTPNICRSVYFLSDIGRKKTDAMKDHLVQINPMAEIRTDNMNILETEIENLIKIVEESDLIVEATDNVKTKILVNGLAYYSVPVLYPAVYDQGYGGEVLMTIPGLTPCYECVMGSLLSEMKEIHRGDWDYAADGQTKPMPCLTADIDVVAARTTKLAIALLLFDTKPDLLEQITEPDCSILFIGNKKKYFIFNEAFQEVWGRTEINKECTCQSLKDEPQRISKAEPADSSIHPNFHRLG